MFRHQHPSRIQFIISLCLIFGVFFSLSFSYIQSEWLTTLYLNNISNNQKLCLLVHESGLKYVKLVEYQRYTREAKLYCIYDNLSNNSVLYLALKDNVWVVYSARTMIAPRALIWPIYK